MHTKNGSAWALACLVLAGIAIFTAQDGRGQDEGGVAQRWEYRLLVWEPADTENMLRKVTDSTDLSNVDEMAQSLARDIELRDHPSIQAAIEERIAELLVEVGESGWEAYWLRERPIQVGGEILEVPTVFLRRPAD